MSFACCDHHEATRLAGVDPDYLTRDLHDAIARGEEVEYELDVQLMEIADELKQDFDPLDPTKTWPESKFPLMPVGRMVLNRKPENFFAEVEQGAFCPASIVPGIEFSADKCCRVERSRTLIVSAIGSERTTSSFRSTGL